MIELLSVYLRFSDSQALDGADLLVEKGECLALTGPSGAGKTSLLRVIAGLETPDSGGVIIAGKSCSSRDSFVPPGRRGIGFVFQQPALWPHLSLYSNVAYGLDHPRSAEGKRRTRTLLDKLGLVGLEGRKPHQLSGGEAQRASIARALAPEPEILLLDEPFTALDGPLKQRVIDLLKEEAEKNSTTMIVAVHDEEAGKKFCKTVAKMSLGRVVFQGSWNVLKRGGESAEEGGRP